MNALVYEEFGKFICSAPIVMLFCINLYASFLITCNDQFCVRVEYITITGIC